MATAPPDPPGLGCHCRKSTPPSHPTRRAKPLFRADSTFQDHNLYSFSDSELSDSTIIPLRLSLSNGHDLTTYNPWRSQHSDQFSTTTQHHQSSQAPIEYGSRYWRHEWACSTALRSEAYFLNKWSIWRQRMSIQVRGCDER